MDVFLYTLQVPDTSDPMYTPLDTHQSNHSIQHFLISIYSNVKQNALVEYFYVETHSLSMNKLILTLDQIFLMLKVI